LIESVTDMEGGMCSDQHAIEGAFLDYYKSLFRARPAVNNIEAFLSGIPCNITRAMNEKLLCPCTFEKVGLALQNMYPFKAAAPDGFTASFYQRNWATIGEKVCRAITNFLHLGYMDEEINYTNIVLIPKKQNASSIIDFRSIALCNVIYKITSKVLAHQLKVVLPSIISPN
jgi:hypothetical protein